MGHLLRRGNIVGLLAFAGGLGCAHQQVRAANPVQETRPVAAAQTPAPPAEATPSQESIDLAAVLSGDVLHFSFDAANLTEASRTRLQKIADVLGRYQDVKLRISGNCDERGTEEFNLALGDRRAAVAKKYLTKLGIDGSRVSIISYGKDHPVADGHDEQAWAQNRRDDMQPNPGN